MKRILLFFVISVTLLNTSFSQSENTKKVFAGGMFLQIGQYLPQTNTYEREKGISYGLGGLLKFNISEHFMIGTTGGNIQRNYTTPESEFSYISLGYGGLLFGWTSQKEKFKYSLTTSAAMGKKSQLHILSQTGNTLNNANYKENLSWLIVPGLSMEYFMTEKLSLFLTMDFFTGFNQSEIDFLIPSARFGVLFNR
jgi:hypothetical protein